MAGSLKKVGVGKEDCVYPDDESYPLATWERQGSLATLSGLTKMPNLWLTHTASINARYYNSGALTDTTISTACADIGTTNQRTLYIEPGDWVIDANLDLSSYTNIVFAIDPGADLQIATGVTLTFPAPGNIIASSSQQIFTCTGTGAIAFNTEPGGPVYPDWWTANATPGTTSMTDAINAALTAAEQVFLLNQDYNTDSGSINMPGGRSLCGTGYHSTIVSNYGGSVITTSDKTSNVSYLKIKDIGITGSNTASSIGINFEAVTTSLIENVYITDMKTGIYMAGSSANSTASSYNRIRFARIVNAATYAINIETSGTGERANGNRIEFPLIAASGVGTCNIGINATQIDSLIIEGGTIENITSNAIDFNDVINSKINNVYFDLLSSYAIALDSDCEDNSIINPTIPGGLKRINDGGSDTIIFDDEYSKLIALSTEIGTELVDDGDFSAADPNTAWDTTNCTLASDASGQSGNCLQITRTGGTTQSAYQDVSLVTGRFYRITVYVKQGSIGGESFEVQYGSDIILSGTATASWVKHSTVFRADSLNNYIYLQRVNGNAGTLFYDECSIKEVGLQNNNEVVYSPGTMGGLALTHKENTGTSTNGNATFTISLDIPSGAKIIGCQLRVDVALSHNWDAEYNDGASLQAICTNKSKVLETKLNFLYNENANTPIMDADTDIVITVNGAANFTTAPGQYVPLFIIGNPFGLTIFSEWPA